MAMLNASNEAIINTVRANASLDYRTRVPDTTKANLAKTLATIQESPILWNEFQNILINRIGLVVMDKNMTFKNRLAPLKSGGMEYGGIVQELDAQLIEGEAYDINDTNVFKTNPPEVISQYHKVNRRDKYMISVNEDLLEEAFVTDGQLAPYVNSLFVLPQQSAEWDEYKIMLELLGMYQSDGTGFANYNVADVQTAVDKETAGKALTQKIRETYLYTKDFYRQEFNKCKADAFSTDLVLITTPAVQANLDVQVLANAFHMDMAKWLADRVVLVDEFPAQLAGTQALLLDDKFYRCYDVKRRTVSIQNPSTLTWNYWLHIWQILSVSCTKNAIRFSTANTNINITTQPTVSTISMTVAGNVTEFDNGDIIQIGATVTYSDGTTNADAVYIITGANSATGETVEVLPESGIWIDREGKLHISSTAANRWDEITITAYANEDKTKTATKTLTSAQAE